MSSKIKVILIGDFGVGKTCLLNRFCTDSYSPDPAATVTPTQVAVQVTNDYQRTVSLDVWDTAGQDKYQAVAPIYYRNSDCAVICFERGGESSIQRWLTTVRSHCSTCVFVVAATKCDLISDDDKIQFQTTVDQLAQNDIQAGYLTSAVTGDDVKQLFGFVANLDETLRQRLRASVQSLPPEGGGQQDGCC